MLILFVLSKIGLLILACTFQTKIVMTYKVKKYYNFVSYLFSIIYNGFINIFYNSLSSYFESKVHFNPNL